jgi:hypothetical protein
MSVVFGGGNPSVEENGAISGAFSRRKNSC